MRLNKFSVFMLSGALMLADSAHATRLKDIVSIKGVRENQLIGYGLIVGLKGTGDSKQEYTGMSMAQMLKQLGVEVKADQIESKNVAAVVITANLQPFARAGSRMDVNVSSIGDAKSLAGGTLLMTPLRGGDRNVYAVAQGPVSLGGLNENGSSKAHPTVALIANGAIVEREVAIDFADRNALRLALQNPDFTTAARVVKAINKELGGLYARARDAGTVDIVVPYDFEGGIVELIAGLERIQIETDNKAKVIINERTGTIVMGDAVRISPVAIAHGSLTLEIKGETTPPPADVRNPAQAKTVGANPPAPAVNPSASVDGNNGDKLVSVNNGATLRDVVRALNTIGVSPKDLVAIMQSLKAQGALHADLEIF